jgi:hypothetical protein
MPAAGSRPLLIGIGRSEAFAAGLAEYAAELAPSDAATPIGADASPYAVDADPLPPAAELSCLVYAGPAVDDAVRNLRGRPLIVFGWMDDEALPAETLAVFDDSIWALTAFAVAHRAAAADLSVPASVRWRPSTALSSEERRSIRAAAAARSVHNSL